MTFAASLASGTPMALLTNGTVREARGFTSRMKMPRPSRGTANWTFIKPRTSSSRAIVFHRSGRIVAQAQREFTQHIEGSVHRKAVDKQREAAERSQRMAAHDHVLVLRTLSKFGLAGVRLGYLCGAAALIDEIDKVRPPYNVSVLNATAALFALEQFHGLGIFSRQYPRPRTVAMRIGPFSIFLRKRWI